MAAGFRALRSRNYRLFFVGQLVSLAGTWMMEVAQAWLVLRLTDSPLALGAVMTVRYLPTLLFALFGGVLADRIPKRRLLLITQAILLVQTIVLAVLTSTGLISMAAIYVLSAVRGLADALDGPVRHSIVVELVGPQDVGNAVALNSTMFNVARIVGPALGGMVVAVAGIAACFYLNALSFLGVLVALSLMRPAEFFEVPRPVRGPLLGQVREGLRYALTTPDVALILIVLFGVGTFGYNFQVVLPLMAKYALHAGPATLGLLTAALGAGSLLAAVGAAYRTRFSSRLLLTGAMGFSGMLLLVGLSQWAAVTAVLLVGTGFCGIVFHTTANTRLQLIVPNELRGRVMSMYSLLFVGTTPIGSLLVGGLAQRQGVDTAVVEMAVLCGLTVLLAVIYAWRTRRARALAALQTAR